MSRMWWKYPCKKAGVVDGKVSFFKRIIIIGSLNISLLFVPITLIFYRTHVHMGSDHWVAMPVSPYRSFLKPCEDLVKTVNAVNVVKI